MKISNRLLAALVTLGISTFAFSQGGTLSPYSQYALGEQSAFGGSMNRGMNGLGIGVYRGANVNPLNPASYSAVDSVTFLFDMGISGQITNFNESGHKVNARQANFEYVLGSFRAWKNVGIAFGLVPMTNVGYKYSNASRLDDAQHSTVTTTHTGDGGLHQLFLGVGVRPVKFLSVGVNAGYLWGGYDRNVVTNSSSAINSLSKMFSASVHSYNLEFGLQYYHPIGKNDMLTIGAKYNLGHKLGSNPECMIISTNSTVSKADTTRMSVKDGLELPHTIGLGASYIHGTKWLIGADIEMQRWEKTQFPDYSDGQYILRSGLLDNSYRLNVGGEYCPRWNSRNFFHRIRYRAGVGYTTPYYKINGQEGPRQISATIGFGIPIMNSYNNRSVLNISAQYINNSASGLIKENTFRINLGLTFNEKWFAKWKVE